jgi:hypothetical protein
MSKDKNLGRDFLRGVAVIGGLALIIGAGSSGGSKITAAEKANPTCKSDYTKCADIRSR